MQTKALTRRRFFDLIDHKVDVVAIPVPMKVEEERYNIRPENPAKHKWDPTLRLLEVECVGTGFIKLSRKAMHILWEKGTPYHDKKERRLICDVQIIEGGMISEDVQICKKLTDEGVKIYVDIMHTCDHFGVKRYKGDYQTKYAQSMLEDILEKQK